MCNLIRNFFVFRMKNIILPDRNFSEAVSFKKVFGQVGHIIIGLNEQLFYVVALTCVT